MIFIGSCAWAYGHVKIEPMMGGIDCIFAGFKFVSGG